MSGPNQSNVYTLETSGNNILTGCLMRGVFVSTDFGQTWAQTSIRAASVHAFSKSDSFTYCGTDNGEFFRSVSNGIDWTEINFPLLQAVQSLGSFGSKIFVGTNHLIFFSSDYGVNWNPTQNINNFISDLHVINDYTFAATYGNGIYRTTNDGTNWIQRGLYYQYLNCIDAIDNLMIAGADSFGLSLSTNLGETWIQSELDSTDVKAIAHINSSLFAGTWNDGVYYSSNHGLNWIQINEGLADVRIYSMTIAGNYIYIGTTGRNIWRRPLSEIIGIKNISSEIPENFKLHQNFPNPFNPTTTISFELTKSAYVELTVIDVSGKVCNTLVKEDLNAGSYSVDFSGAGLSSGVYCYKLVASTLENARNLASVRKMVLLK
jgi:photosystem II stability/assembly factor-like uncharacterized protein